MIYVTPEIAIDESELRERFIRASGPGGQNVNKLSSAVQLRFDVAASTSLPEDVKLRLVHLAGQRMTEDGVLIIDKMTPMDRIAMRRTIKELEAAAG